MISCVQPNGIVVGNLCQFADSTGSKVCDSGVNMHAITTFVNDAVHTVTDSTSQGFSDLSKSSIKSYETLSASVKILSDKLQTLKPIEFKHSTGFMLANSKTDTNILNYTFEPNSLEQGQTIKIYGILLLNSETKTTATVSVKLNSNSLLSFLIPGEVKDNLAKLEIYLMPTSNQEGSVQITAFVYLSGFVPLGFSSCVANVLDRSVQNKISVNAQLDSKNNSVVFQQLYVEL